MTKKSEERQWREEFAKSVRDAFAEDDVKLGRTPVTPDILTRQLTPKEQEDKAKRQLEAAKYRVKLD